MSVSNELLEAEIKELEREISYRNARIEAIRDMLNARRSLLFIQQHQITLDQVELSRGHDRPYFGNIRTFLLWVREHSKKPWLEWNDRIYSRKALEEGAALDSPALLKHVTTENGPDND